METKPMPVVRAMGLTATLIVILAVLATCRLASGMELHPTPFIRVALCRLLLRVLGVKVRFEGTMALEPALWVSNHVFWLDVIVIGSQRPVSFLAKREVRRWPLIGAVACWCGTVFVDRVRRRSILGANHAMARRIVEGWSVVLFPEGTTFDGNGLGSLRTSHFACLRSLFRLDPGRSRARVQPLVLRYSDPAAAWLGDASLVPHVWSMLRRPRIACTIVAVDAMTVAPGFDRKALGRDLAAAMGAALDAIPNVTPLMPDLRRLEETRLRAASPGEPASVTRPLTS